MRFRGIEWSLRAFASTRALRLFLRARAVIKFVLRAASTLETKTGEHFINFPLILRVGLLECVKYRHCAIISRPEPQKIFKTQIYLMLYSLPPAVEWKVAGINNTCVFSENVAGFTWFTEF